MRTNRQITAWAIAPLVALALLAGCGSSGGSSGDATTTTAAAGSTSESSTTAPPSSSTTAGGGGEVKSGAVAIEIKGFAFDPKEVTVKVGAKVTWTNDDSATHTATGDKDEFNTKSIKKGADGSFTFAKAGTFTYHCEIHPTMTATITVQ